MQETGSNLDEQKIDLSTELLLGGLSFFEGSTQQQIESAIESVFGSCEKQRVYIYGMQGGKLFAACIKDILLFAEVLPCATSDDALYYCSVINTDFEVAKCRIVVGGVGCDDNIRVLKTYFKQVVDANSKR